MKFSRSIGVLLINLLILALIGTWATPSKACGGFFRSRSRCEGQSYSYQRACQSGYYYSQPVAAPQTPSHAQQSASWADYWTNAVGPVTNPYPLGWRDPKNGWIPASDPRAMPTVQAPAPAPQTAIQIEADPYGFVVWLNAERGRRGLRAVAWDKTCEYHAYQNNLHQASRGLGHFHHVMRRQNAGMGPSATIWPAWTTSPGHADALFDPSITVVGLHIHGQWQTFNAN